MRDILRRHRDYLIPRLKAHGVAAPAAVQEVLEWLMAKNPDDRPASADEIAEEIQALLEVKKSNNLLLGVLALAVVAVGVSLYSVLTSEKGPVIVEVESPDAQEERDRNARLEVEVAFTRAMAAQQDASYRAIGQACIEADQEHRPAVIAHIALVDHVALDSAHGGTAKHAKALLATFAAQHHQAAA